MLNKACSLFILLIFVILITSEISNSEVYEYTSVNKSAKAPNLNDARSVLVNYHKDSQNIDRSIEIVEGVLKEQPDNVEALNFLSRVWLTYGYAKARTKEDLILAFSNGLEVSKKALQIAPDNADAHFFYVANLASLGDAKGMFSSLFMLPEIRRELDLILRLDPNHAYALGMNGALYLFLPGILGGDIKISEIYMRRALSINPHMSSAKLYLAMNLRKQKRYDEAIEVLLDLVRDKEPSFYPDWYLNRKYAIIMISQIREESR
jgi:tetratricopeptide (TPR) repeat protein